VLIYRQISSLLQPQPFGGTHWLFIYKQYGTMPWCTGSIYAKTLKT